MNVTVTLADDDVQRIANAVVDRLGTPGRRVWFDVKTAGEYCCMSEEAVRGAAKRGQLRSRRTETGRLRFHISDLDRFMGSDTAS